MDGYFGGLKTADGKKPVPLKSIEVDVTVKGFIANVTSRLVFKNTESNPIEAVYEFPIDDQSAVYHFEAEIEGRTIVAECREKQQAKDTYQAAVSHGLTATLLEEDASCSDIFRCLIGNLPADTEAVVKFSYVAELSLDLGGIVRFELPTILNPRYNPKVNDGGTPASVTPVSSILPEAPSPDSISTNEPPPYTLTFKAKILSTTPILSVASVHDELGITFSDDKKEAQVSLKNAFKPDHSFSLDISLADPYTPHVIAELGQENKDGLLKQDLLMVNFFPEFNETDRSGNHEFIFLIDRSGSMQGARIHGAKETLLLFLKSLPPGCYFNIIGFGSHFEPIFPEGSREYSEKSLEAAITYQKAMHANFGGTEILQPLLSVYNKPPMTTHSRQIFLMTDGEVKNTNMVIDLVRKNAINTRVFTFGIGDGASSALIRGVARAGHGTAEFIKENQRMQPLVMRTLKSAMQATVTDLHLDWQLGGSLAFVQAPQQMPPLFGGSRLIVYAILQDKAKLDGRVQLRGKIGERNLEFTVNVDEKSLISSNDDSLAIHRLAAKAQIQQLEDQEKDDVDKNKASIILLSTSANIISRHTSMVGVDKDRPDKVTGELIQSRVPQLPSKRGSSSLENMGKQTAS